MTDRECLEQLIDKLKLNRVHSNNEWFHIGPNSYNIRTDDNQIIFDLGSGIGSEGLFVSFTFDVKGSILHHTIYE